MLVARDVDLILGMECSAAPRRDDARFHREELLGDALDAVLASDHPLAGRARIDLAELADEDWVAPPVGWSCDEVFLAGCRGAGFSPQVAHRAGDWQAVMGLVAGGLGISLVPRLAHTAPPPGVVIVPLTGVPPKRHVFVACRAGAESSPAIRAVLDALADSARRQASQHDSPAGRESAAAQRCQPQASGRLRSRRRARRLRAGVGRGAPRRRRRPRRHVDGRARRATCSA